MEQRKEECFLRIIDKYKVLVAKKREYEQCSFSKRKEVLNEVMRILLEQIDGYLECMYMLDIIDYEEFMMISNLLTEFIQND